MAATAGMPVRREASRLRARARFRPCPRDGPRGGEAGIVTIQIVILMPIMFLILFTGMQAALMYQGRTAAIAAAQEGARAAAAQDGTVEHGRAAAADLLAAIGDEVLSGASVAAVRDATTATVTVTGRTLSVVPGWTPTITQSATVPVERLT